MMLFVTLFVAMLLVFWAVSRLLKTLFWQEWHPDVGSNYRMVKGAVLQQLRCLSPQNAVAQALVDFEMTLKNLRTSMLMLCFQKIGLILIGFLILLTLQWQIMATALVIATLVLAVAFKKPTKWIQVFLLAACLWGLYQACFYQINQGLYAGGGTDLALAVADGRWFQLIALLIFSFLMTLLIRFEFWSVLIASLLFFAGAVPITNAIGLIIGEELAWVVFWYWGARKSSKVSRVIFREYALLVFVSALGFLFLALLLRGWGWLQISVFEPLVDKKILFLSLWAVWEIFQSVLLLTWGHFRSRSSLVDTTEAEPIRFPTWLLGGKWYGFKGWLVEQLEFRKNFLEKKQNRMQSQLDSLTAEEKLKFPKGFLEKTLREIQSLKDIVSSLKS